MAGIEPALTAFQAAALPAELHPDIRITQFRGGATGNRTPVPASTVRSPATERPRRGRALRRRRRPPEIECKPPPHRIPRRAWRPTLVGDQVLSAYPEVGTPRDR